MELKRQIVEEEMPMMRKLMRKYSTLEIKQTQNKIRNCFPSNLANTKKATSMSGKAGRHIILLLLVGRWLQEASPKCLSKVLKNAGNFRHQNTNSKNLSQGNK